MNSARIGVVEDDIVARRLLQLTLGRLGHDVRVYGSAEELLEQFATHDYDAIITDFSLPGKNGADLIKQIRETDSDVVLVLLTGSASVDVIQTSLQDCRVDYLLKPVRPADLQNLIATTLAAMPPSHFSPAFARHLG